MPGDGLPSGVHFGSYWMGENDIVYLMMRDLADLCRLTAVDTEIYSGRPSPWYREDPRYNPSNPVRWLDHQRVMAVVEQCGADFVVVNAGGMSLEPRTIDALNQRGTVAVGISLSDPDVFPYHGRVYWQLYDLFYTNSLYSLETQYGGGDRVRLLPFAASERLHRPMPEVEKTHDVVVVGHARRDRVRLVKKLRRVCSVGTYGGGWGSDSPTVHGVEHVQAINRGRIYLSFAGTVAGFVNVKVGLFEAAASRVLLATSCFAELERYFRFGLEVVGYSSDRELIDLIEYYLAHEPVRAWIADNAYRRCLAEHTWRRRWEGVLADVRLAAEKSRESAHRA